jgi:hypothetical protein
MPVRKKTPSPAAPSAGFFRSDEKHALEAKNAAQWIAFAPFVFQASMSLRDLGLLSAAEAAGDAGISMEDLARKTGVSDYGVRVLVEAGLGIGLLYIVRDSLYALTKTGHWLLHDDMTRLNMDFTQDVCYQGLFSLKESVQKGRPEGLKVFGSWPTIYEGLSKLPEPAKTSWFRFDHFYSSEAFPEALDAVMKHAPKTLFDVGGNTGLFAALCCEKAPQLSVTILDLPGQLKMAEENLAKRGFPGKVAFREIDLLDASRTFPKGADVIWMSQFLDCFSEDEVVSILSRAKEGLNPGGAIFVLEPCWDLQRFEASAFSLLLSSLYFTAMANGNSRFFCSENLIKCAARAGLSVGGRTDGLGIGHTLFRFVKN